LVGILEARIPKFYGLISYALYIIHLPVALWVDRFTDLSRFGAPIGLSRNMVDFVVVAAVSTVLATFSYYAVERPFLRLKDRLKDRSAA
jgi:peptidoglycan/LPS O-acetylase OafA/YrhL